MSFAPNVRDSITPMGLVTVVAAGTSILLNDNWSPKWDDSAVSDSNKVQYAYSARDIVFNFPPGNTGGIYVVTKGGSKNVASSIIAYFPKVAGVPQTPQNLSRYFGNGKFAPYALALDADQDGDGAWPVGVND